MPNTFLLALMLPLVRRANKWIDEKQINWLNKREARKRAAKAAEAAAVAPPVSSERSPKVAACIRAIESDMLKRSLADSGESQVAQLCSDLLQKALGDERMVVRLVEFEWMQCTDVIDAFRRAQERWERDYAGLRQ